MGSTFPTFARAIIASPIASVLSILVALEAIRTRYNQKLGEWRPKPGMLWAAVPARPVIWGIDEISKAHAGDAVGYADRADSDKLIRDILRAAGAAMDQSSGSLRVVFTSLKFRPDYLTTLQSGRGINWMPLRPIDVSKLWEHSPKLKEMVERNPAAKRFLFDCGGHPRSIAFTIFHLTREPGASYDGLLTSLFSSNGYNLAEFSNSLDLDVLAPCILASHQDFDPVKPTSIAQAHRDRLYLNSTDERSLLQIPFTSPIFVLQACKRKKSRCDYKGLERAIFALLEEYFKLGTSLESRAEFSVEQPAWARFERAVLIREMLVRLFLHYQRGKNDASAESTVRVRLEDLYGVSLAPGTRFLPLHSAALNASDIVLDVRQPGGILDLKHKMPLRPTDFAGRDVLSTAVKCVSNQDGMDALFVDRVAASVSSSVEYHELLIECKWSAQGATTQFSLKDMSSKLKLLQEQDGRGERAVTPV